MLLKMDEFLNLVNFMNIFDILNLCKDDRLFITYQKFIEKYSRLNHLEKYEDGYLEKFLNYKNKDINESYHLNKIRIFRDYLFFIMENITTFIL